MNDEEIVSLFFERQESALTELKSKYGPLCQRISENILGSPDDAEEVLNDALLAVWKTVPPLVPNNLRAYLIKTVRNLSLKRLSYNLAGKRQTYSKVAFDELEEVLSDSSASLAVERIDFEMAIDGFMKGLTPEARAIFVKRYFLFDSLNDISKDLRISLAKVKSSLHRTRAALRKYLSEKGE